MKKNTKVLIFSIVAVCFAAAAGLLAYLQPWKSRDAADDKASVTTATAGDPGQDDATAGDASEFDATADDASESDAAVSESYRRVDLSALYSDGMLILSNDKIKISPADNESGGFFLSGKVEDINSCDISIEKEFTFDSNPVGRVSMQAVSEKDADVNALIFMDEEEEPISELALTKYIEESKASPSDAEEPENPDYFAVVPTGSGWDTIGDVTDIIYDRKITGNHRFSFRLHVESSSDEASVLIRSIEFSERSEIPILHFNLDESETTIDDMNNSFDKSVSCTGAVSIEVPDGYVCEYTGEEMSGSTEYELDSIKGRGNSTWESSDKKAYKFKLEEKADLFGMGEEKNWALLADRFDDSLCRNRITYWLGAQMGLNYTPQLIPVELILNNQYYGTYYLAESVRFGESRLAIDELTEEDTSEPEITGGYLIAMSPYYEEDDRVKFWTTGGVCFMNDTPDGLEEGTDAQISYIRDYVQKTEDAIFGEDHKDENGVSYTEYMDLDSMTNYWWIQTFSVNPDAYVTDSTFLYKEREGKLFWGPIWDFDYAWGNDKYRGEIYTEGFEHMDMSMLTQYSWNHELVHDAQYMQSLRDNWKVMDEKLGEIIEEGGLLDRYYDEMKIAAYYNFEKWGYNKEDHTSYEEEVERLRNWIDERRTWVENNIDNLDSMVLSVNFEVDGESVKTSKIVLNMPLPEVPDAPEKEGQVFLGWYDSSDNKADSDIIIDSDVTFTARYISKEEAIKAEELFFADKYTQCSILSTGYQFNYVIYPLDAQDKKVTWTVSDESVASIDNEGSVTPKTEGTVVVTATLENGFFDSYTLDIIDYEKTDVSNTITDVTLKEDAITIKKGEYTQIEFACTPENTCGYYSFESEDESIATVDNYGVVTGIGSGTCTIRVTESETEKEMECKVTVE